MSIAPAIQNSVTLPDWAGLDVGVDAERLLWLRARREAALSALSERGLPTTDDEEWKYTSIARLREMSLRPDPEGSSVLPQANTDELGISLRTGPELVFVNGNFRPKLSRLKDLPKGVRVESLAEALKSDTHILEKHLANYADIKAHPFAALNTLWMRDGALIVLEKGAVLEEPIHLHYIADSPDGDIHSHPRNLIVAGENSRALIVESFIGFPGQVYFRNVVTEVVLGDAAGIEHYKLQDESEQAFHIAAMHVHQGTGSYFQSRAISLGAGLARYDIDIRQESEGAECSVNGLYLVMNSQHVDNHLRIDHLKPHGTSNLLFKGVLDGRGRAVFNGKVVVHKGASKTNTDQINKNLLLSDEAEADPKPELEIYHNDVKCTHGATVGQLDADALFYLRSRGIALAEARQILTLGFAKEVLQSLKVERLEAYCECQLIQRLGGMRHE